MKVQGLRLLTDCWYMNWTLMQPVLEMGYEVVGQIPLNRALYALPLESTAKKTWATQKVWHQNDAPGSGEAYRNIKQP